MRRPRRRWLAAAVLLVAGLGVVAVLTVGGDRQVADQPAFGAGGSGSVTVTAPGGPFGAATSQTAPASGTVAVPGGIPQEAAGGRERVESDDGRDYDFPPTRGASAVDGGAEDGADSDAEVSEPWPAPPADPTPAVSAAVAAAEAVGVHQAVVILDRATGAVMTEQNADEPFPALSLVKLMIAADVIDGSGTEVAADDATRAWMQEMISTSDDVTAADFYQLAGADELVNRVVERFGLTGSSPTPDGEYWGNVQTSAADMASLLSQLLADPATAPVVGPAMVGSTAIAADGLDQRFGMRVVPGAGSKQGWGCCLSGVTGIHSMGFTPDRIVVVLSSAETDDESLGEQDGLALEADPGAQVSIAAVTDTVRAALGGPAS